MGLKALALNCTLKATGTSSTQKMLDLILKSLKAHGIEGTSVRMAALDIKPGVTSDEREGDDWPGDRYSERKESAAELEKRVNLKSAV